jgi:hypothetical protein
MNFRDRTIENNVELVADVIDNINGLSSTAAIPKTELITRKL